VGVAVRVEVLVEVLLLAAERLRDEEAAAGDEEAEAAHGQQASQLRHFRTPGALLKLISGS
jgi:hypothetical protein